MEGKGVNMNNDNKNASGVGFVGLLTLLFVGLKFTGYINWSWFWVLSPITFSSVIVLSLIIIFVIKRLVDYKRL